MLKEKLKKIITITILIIMLFPYTFVLAAITQEQAGNAIAQFAISFCENYGYESGTEQCIYSYNDDNRWFGYRLEKTSGVAIGGARADTRNFTNKYPMDCVAFLSMVVHQTLGIGDSQSQYFLCPTDSNSKANYNFLEQASGGMKPGDLVYGKGHVWINIEGHPDAGENVTADSICGSTFRGPHLTDNPGSGRSNAGYFRIKESVLKDVTMETVQANLDKVNAGKLTGGSSVGLAAFEESEFYYNGIPDGKYSVTAGAREWIVDILSQLFDYILGILTMCQRMVFVGWAAIVENCITATVKSIDESAGTEGSPIYEPDPTSMDVEEDAVTIESIIFNKIKVLDINFFK